MEQTGLIQRLAQAANSNRLIIVCGAGVSLSATRGDSRAGWAGFLRYGLSWCKDCAVQFEGDQGLARADADLLAGDLVSAADKIQRALEKAGEWTRFLAESIGNLRLSDPTIAKLVRRLHSPIATTNYDTLLEDALGLTHVTWQGKLFGAALRGENSAIAHLHGIYTEPASVVLGSRSYGRHQADAHAQALQQALALQRSMLFVGVGDGLEDPNIGELIRFLDREFLDTAITHFWLATEEQASSLRPDSVIKPIVFGTNAATELIPFFRGLLDKIRPEKKTVAAGYSKTDLLAVPLLPSFDISGPSLRELWPNRLIDVRVKPLRGLDQKAVPFSQWIKSRTLPPRVALVGAPGGGKSTALRTLALAENEVDLPTRHFLHAQDLADADAIGGETNSMLIIDALDELSDLELERSVDLLVNEDRQFLWMSCRSEFLGRRSAAKLLLDRVDQVLEVQPLEGGEVALFIDRFLESSGADNLVALRLNQWRKDNSFEALLRVPLNLTLALFLAAGLGTSAESRVPPRNRYELYAQFYEHWLGYETKRLSLSKNDGRLIRAEHARIANELYARRLNATLPPLRDDDSERTEISTVIEMLLKRERRDPAIIRRFLHDTYMEYLLAERLLDQLQGLSEGGISLDVAFNDDVNAFVRDGFNLMEVRDREGVLQRLEQIYAAGQNEREREHALYYIGRLDLPLCPEILIEAFHSNPAPLSRRAAALGAILHGQTDLEQKYLTLIAESEQEELLNRSVQLVYFGDARGELHDFVDRGGPWSRTRKALVDRISHRDLRSVRLRWWDLQTALSLFRDRGAGLDTAEKEVLRKVLDEHRQGSTVRDLGILSVVRELIAL